MDLMVELKHTRAITLTGVFTNIDLCRKKETPKGEDVDGLILWRCGGRDLSGNKRTNKDQSFDQKFEKSNEALRVSCKKGYPVRVVRSHKEKRSFYAPEGGVRYDGIYRIEKCWRKVGIQGFKVCRYLFVRCDNEPAPWTSDERGDQPRPLPVIKELKKATDIAERKEKPSWDFDVSYAISSDSVFHSLNLSHDLYLQLSIGNM
ncbi:hypothetical protein IFM89_011164 [Coptis chinensis]|uniref:YDG domain-containing protein n=1 Tax=Coptis chinensis TaxID=261450 RepID=A0A835LU18_9MAGN|nr:hypothetical protein IFM89_011164 [Coptis chinensis]